MGSGAQAGLLRDRDQLRTKTWPFLGHTRVELDLHFTTVRGGSGKIRFWLSSLANHLHYNVPPGTKTKITFTVTPLFHGGTVYLEALMVKEHSSP